MPGCRRISRQRKQYGTTLLEAVVTVVAAHYALGSRLMQSLVEHELAATLQSRGDDAPTSNHFGKVGNISLAVPRTYTYGVQLHDFARKILVDSLATTLASKRVWTDRLCIIEVKQHCGMRFDR